MGKSIRETMQEFTVNQALNYLEGNPEENIPKLMAFVDRFKPKDWYTSQRNAIRKSIEEKNNWYPADLKTLRTGSGRAKSILPEFYYKCQPEGQRNAE